VPHEDYEGNYFDKADEFWHNLGFDEYELQGEELREGRQLFQNFLQDVTMGYRPEASYAFYEWLDYFGMDESQFDWDEFREWYDAL
jgi:hypothetical protein